MSAASHALLALFALLAFLGSTAVRVQATDILFFNNGGCGNNKSDYGFCTIEVEGECCEASDPLCYELACTDCENYYLMPFWGLGNCIGYSPGICTVEDREGINCCMILGSNATCSGHVGPASSTKLLAQADHKNVPCTNPRHLDGFSYIDTATNMRREITNMTKEVHDQVMTHYRNGDYTNLNKMAVAV